MKHLPYSIPLPRRLGVYEYLNITRLGTLKIEAPPMGTSIEKDTTGAPGTFAAIMSYPADWLDGETIRITKPAGMVTIDCYKANELYTATDVATTMAAGLMAAADKTKLDGIATAATANDTDANLKDRANHTGTQAISTVTGLTAALAAKVETSLLGAVSGVATLDGTGKLTPAQAPAGMGTGDMLKSTYDTTNNGIVDAAESAPWAGITGKPSTFTPSTHTHAQSDITNLVTDLAAKIPASEKGANSGVATLDVTGKVPTSQLPAMGTGDMLKSTYDTDNDGIVDSAAAAPWAGITGKPSTFTPSTHTHAQSDITNLVTDLAGKANTTHTHAQSDVTGLVTALSNKVETSLLGAVSGVATLDGAGKVPSAQLPPMGGTGDMLQSVYDTNNNGIVDAAEAVPWSGITSKPSVFTPDTHTHAQSDVTGLVTALSNKVETSLLGANSGVATLDVTGKVPSSQLPTMAGLESRATATLTTGSLANGASSSTTITLGKTARILSVQLDRAARVAFYATTAIRDADVGRAVLVDPPNGTYLEVVSTGAATYYMSGTASGLVSNMEGSPTTAIALNVYNLSGSSSTVTVTVVYLKLEA